MKNFNKIFISLALVLVLALPLLVGGCFGGPKEGIKIYSNFKTEYQIGEQLDLTDGKIEYTDEDGKKTIIEITTQMVTSFNTDTVGNRSLIITYQGNTCTVNYSVYRVYKATVGAVYTASPTIMLFEGSGYNTNDYYDAIKFTDADTLKLTVEQKTTPYDQLDWSEENQGAILTFDCTTSVVNRKTVYTFSGIKNSIEMLVVVTAIDDNTLHCSLTDVAGNLTRTTTLTKVA